ncbi:MAG: HAMP domain-containing sensor histidine kinase [Bacillota bacterium]|nr:HAMP domain-containing sensor histidine kinase [Bacillota bacterium]
MKRFAVLATSLKKWIKGSLTTKSFLLILALLLAVSCSVYGFISLFLPAVVKSDNVLDEKATAMVSELRKTPAKNSGRLFAEFIRETGADINLMNAQRKEVDFFTFSVSGKTADINGKEYPFRFSDSDEEFILTVLGSQVRAEQITEGINRSLPWTGTAILILSFGGAFFYSRYSVRPILRMSKIASKIASQDFGWYCPDLREDEIGVLAKSLNDMSDQLSAAMSALHNQNRSLQGEITLEKEREHRRLLFFSAVSHQLKTPISIVIGQLEGMKANIGVYKDRDKYLARSSEILASLDCFIREILSISQMDLAGGSLIDKQMDLSAVLEEVMDDCSDLAEASEIKMSPDITPDIHIQGDSELMRKALGNIAGNAVTHSPRGATVSVQLFHQDNRTRVEIVNSGAYIPKEHLPRLFDAFYRVNMNSGSGTGLGLYITRMILEAYNAEYSIENCKNGVRFTVIFNPPPDS